MNETIKLEFYKKAVGTLFGYGKEYHDIERTADALELQYRRGLSSGYSKGFNDGLTGAQPVGGYQVAEDTGC